MSLMSGALLGVLLAAEPLSASQLEMLAELQAEHGDAQAAALESAKSMHASGFRPEIGRNVKWAGLNDMALNITDVCPPEASGPGFECVEVADGSYNFPAIDSIVIPARTAHSLMCQVVTPIINYRADNDSGATEEFLFFVSPRLTVYNPVLEDPTLINAETGLPFDGAYATTLTGFHLDQRQLAAGEAVFEWINHSRYCISGVVSATRLAELGLSERQIRRFFNSDTRLEIGLRGVFNALDEASIYYGIRFHSD